ncbi:hypothetical protein C7377_1881 [Balneicella halophila]|uniref:Uncharacterized protein n=1 Tax=Balneicella halophila TaxID=1537566 RepID=A0A7L4UNR8_BALHA|nr:hypothetical protein [Balneicella halophila]PVX48857.1 hypothetical protein C7377_1881 [Balneicella halophila]
MTKSNSTLYAIFKDGKHLGNEKGKSKIEAIKNYLKSAGYDNLINDLEFINNYSSEKAINGVHHHLVIKRTN